MDLDLKFLDTSSEEFNVCGDGLEVKSELRQGYLERLKLFAWNFGFVKK